MGNIISDKITETFKLSSRERSTRLCYLAAKEYSRTLNPLETIELETIQFIRKENGEIDKVLKHWKDNPTEDPRK